VVSPDHSLPLSVSFLAIPSHTPRVHGGARFRSALLHEHNISTQTPPQDIASLMFMAGLSERVNGPE
jgi:hypothetical protein